MISGVYLERYCCVTAVSATSGCVAETPAYLAKHTGGREPTLLFPPLIRWLLASRGGIESLWGGLRLAVGGRMAEASGGIGQDPRDCRAGGALQRPGSGRGGAPRRR